MDIFDIVGPIMIGPSSSHTAGVVRIGQITSKIFVTNPNYIEITFYESFAKTYKGHGSDKAIIGGLMGFNPWDEKIRCSLEIAKEKNLKYKFITSDEKAEHPNTIKIEGFFDDKVISVEANSVGGGNILIRKINNQYVEIDGNYDTILINHKDVEGVIMNVSIAVYELNINIASMKVFRSQKGGDAIMVIETDGIKSNDLIPIIEKVKDVRKAALIPSL